MPEKMRVGVSACLLGARVRYDGEAKRDPCLADRLARFVTYLPVCPEVECGFSVPREPMRLTGDPGAPRLVTVRTGRDLTERLRKWTARRVRELATENLRGFIFKSRSPSCGVRRVKVYDDKGGFQGIGTGVFARAFTAHFPLTPVIEESRLHDPALREKFIERMLVMQRWRELCEAKTTARDVLRFHEAHRPLFMSRSRTGAQELGRLIARCDRAPSGALLAAYGLRLMECLA